MRFLAVFGLCAAVFAGGDIDLLVGAAKDPERGVRYAAVQALGKAGAGVETLIAALDDSEWCVRQAAGHALARVGKSAVPALTRAARSTKTHVRVEAIEALRRIGTDDAMKIVVTALDDKDPLVVREALDGIWLHGKTNATAVPGIERYLDSEDTNLMVTAHWALLSADPKSVERIRKRMQQLPHAPEKDDWATRWTKALLEKVRVTTPTVAIEFDVENFARESETERWSSFAQLRKGAKYETALRKLLDSDDALLVRDAAIALTKMGIDVRGTLDDAAAWNALRFLPTLATDFSDGARYCHSDEEFRDWAIVVGRSGKANDDAQSILLDMAVDPKEELRATAIWALGKVGASYPKGITDPSLAVRILAANTMSDRTRLLEIARGRGVEHAVRAIDRLGADPEIASLAASAEPLVRIAVAQALGERTPDALAHDKNRDVRVAVAMVRAFPHHLDDPSARVRLVSIRTHGRQRAMVSRVAAFLSDPNLALSNAAAEVLPGYGADAAIPIARLLVPGDLAIWHYAPRIFEQLGADGAAAVDILIPVLKNTDPTAREVAARCLAAIGPGAIGAAPALVATLSDRRVAVVSHAALALGRIGATDALRDAMKSDHARVRAYAAFALGWIHGEKRGLEQVRYERRLPLLDSGEPDPGVTRKQIEALDNMPEAEAYALCRKGLRSKDKVIASASAARLEYDQKSPWECDRATELMVAEGFRPGHPFDPDTYRYALGSNEVPATLEFLRYPRHTEWDRTEILGHLHRNPRATNIPAITWFSRTEDAIRTEGLDNLDMPFSNTADYRKELERHYGGTLWEIIEKHQGIWSPMRWWLEGEPIPTGRGPLLVAVAEKHWKTAGANTYVAMRAMSRATDAATETFLRRAARENDLYVTFANAALARRGDPIALVRAIDAARRDSDALGLLLEFLPRVGGALLRESLDPGGVRNIREEGSALLGIELSYEPFLGLESSLNLALFDTSEIATIALFVPGCRTKRVAAAILARLANEPPDSLFAFEYGSGDKERNEEIAAFLDATTPREFRKILHRWTRDESEDVRWFAVRVLTYSGVRIEKELIRPHLESIASDVPERWPPWVREEVARDDPDDTEGFLRRRLGMSIYRREVSGEELSEKEFGAILEATRNGTGMAALHKLFRDRIDMMWSGDPSPRPPWLKDELMRRYQTRERGDAPDVLERLALWPDTRARQLYWSILRAGRYQWIDAPQWSGTAFTLGHDLRALPHWRRELESNCCRIAGNVESTFRDLFEIDGLNAAPNYEVGELASDRVLDWFELWGGDVVWSPIVRRFIPRPE